ncbi:MAG: IclR family transcriptional regulator [Pigmentiphaga sp.]|nr:IclR family transcriptional regulator [Pigmentiphaga sp.]
METVLDCCPSSEKYLVPALDRGLRVLCEIGREEQGVGAPELARRLNMPRTTVFRLLATLEQLGFIERAPNGRDFNLGMAVLRLGFDKLASLELTQLGTPLLERLRDEFNYSCHLVVRDDTHVVYVAKAAAQSPMASSVNVGTRLPAHATVLGRVLMADMSLPELKDLYPQGALARRSAFTPGSVEELYQLLAQDRERGFAMQDGFFESGISTIAAPVRNASGAIVAALGLTIPSAQWVQPRSETLVQRVRHSADQLSTLLNYRGQKA